MLHNSQFQAPPNTLTVAMTSSSLLTTPKMVGKNYRYMDYGATLHLTVPDNVKCICISNIGLALLLLLHHLLSQILSIQASLLLHLFKLISIDQIKLAFGALD